MPVSREIRRRALDRANGLCEYCHIRAWPLTVDHVTPVSSRRGAASTAGQPHPELDDLSNLAAACPLCNRGKWDRTSSPDPLTGYRQRLFNPREDRWAEHFAWSEDFLLILGRTPIGRATVAQLQFNRLAYQLQRRTLRAAARAGEPPWPA